MAESSFAKSLLARLKAWQSLYALLKGVRHILYSTAIEGFRIFGKGFQFGGPHGFYNGLEQLRVGFREGRIVKESQDLPKIPEFSLIKEADMNQNERQPWPIFWSRHSDARLVGSSMALLEEGKKLMLESVFGEEFCRSDPSFNYLILHQAARVRGSWTSLISKWSEGFYHWFTDALPRLALLSEFPPETKILVRGPLKKYQHESLQMLGLLERVRETPENHLVIEDYYFTSPVGMTGCTNPYSVEWLRKTFLPHKAEIKTPKKFFMKRSGKTRGIINQEELCAFLQAHGWAIVDLEELSLDKQIAWFYQAEAIVGEHGAGFTNILWSTPGCKVLELCPDNFLNGCYEGIALCNGLDYSFSLFKANPANQFSVSLNIFAELISKF